MAAGIRFTKPERDFIKLSVAACADSRASSARLAEAILEKFERSELGGKKKASGLPVPDAIAAFREVLGNTLVVPPKPGPGWWSICARNLANLGLTRGDCTTIAKVVATKGWVNVKAEYLIREGARFLNESQLPLPVVGRNRVTADMEDL